MKLNLREFTIGITTPLVTPSSPNYRLPSWPPPHDWPVVIDKDGVVVSRWGYVRWDLTPWAGKSLSLNFGDGDAGPNSWADPLDPENANLMRMIAGWFIWGPRAAGSANTVQAYFSTMRQVVALCSRNGISAAKLMRYPKVLERLPESLTSGQFGEAIMLLQRLYDARDVLGFTIVDAHGLERLVTAAPDRGDTVQTPYIPPRIWLYQVERLHECLTDFLAHRERVEACFRFCLDAYIKNFGSLEAALTPGKNQSQNPFSHLSAERAGCAYYGKFSDTAARFGIAELLTKWVLKDKQEATIKHLSSYLSVVTYAGLAYIANFTLQRKEEVASLRTSCLLWEEDEKLGRVAMICGETTKTDPDSDARWIASPSVETAVSATSAVAHLRMTCDGANPLMNPTAADQQDPYLFSTPTEPWGISVGRAKSKHPYEIRPVLRDMYGVMEATCRRLFDREQLRITVEDLQVALRLTPNLPEGEYAVGKVWPLAWHQYRRTGAVNMFASGDVSDSTMQQQMKHLSRLMPIYYGRNHSRMHLNKEVEETVVRAMYEAQAEKIKRAAIGDRFVSPHSPEHKGSFAIKVLSVNEAKELIAMTDRGTVNFRLHRLGGCMRGGICTYGGVESVAPCAGGENGKPCADVLYDREKEPQVRADLHRLTEEMKRLPAGHPRYNAIAAEIRGMENFLNVVSN